MVKHRLVRLLVPLAVMVVLVAGMSVGYAWWSDAIVIQGTVTTGTVSVHWLPDPGDGSRIFCTAKPQIAGGPVAAITAYRDASDDHLAHMKVTNGYPGYWARCYYDMNNNGSIPVKISGLTIQGVPTTSGGAKYFDYVGTTLVYNPAGTDTTSALKITLTDGDGFPLPANPTLIYQKSLRIDVLQGAPQETVLLVNAQLMVEQVHP
jgi:hypothetical protein